MSQSPNAMYVRKNTSGITSWSAHVLCTIIGGENKEHGWIAYGNNEWRAIHELQIMMRAAK